MDTADFSDDDGPLNVVYGIAPRFAAISNLAPAAFVLDGRPYASIEGFWQGLKFPDEADRRRLAALHGLAAKAAGDGAPPATHFEYEGERIAMGSPTHHRLMEQACLAKFTQDAVACAALLATSARTITHVLPQDSRNIPGVVMAGIWMRVRERLGDGPG